MRSHGKLIAIQLALALILGLGLAADATARSTKVSSAISLESVGPDGASGRVTSGRKACRSQRRVSFYRVNSGPSVPSSEPVASTWSRGDGSWSIPAPLSPSEYHAVVEKQRKRGLTCRTADSNSRRF